MAFLQLADNYSMLAQNRSENYIFIPAGYAGSPKDMSVREDYFDNLSDAEFMAMMTELAPFQNQGLSAVGIGAAVAGGSNALKKLIDRRKARVAAGTAKPLFKPGGLISKIGQKIQGKELAPAPMETKSGGITFGGNVDFGGGSETETQPTFFQKYKMPILIGGGLLAIGGIFLATRKKRK